MPTVTINGKSCEFEPGQTILQAANGADVEIPHYCYHDGLSIPALCRICLGECWAPNPRDENKLEPFMGGKLLPTCATNAVDGMVVHTDSPKAVANQKAVMEYLLINHPLDCPVCDQAGECDLQDYSYKFGRGVSRFQEAKVKQPKKNLGPHVYLYSDRCIMCTLCVRFTREVPGTGEIAIVSRGNTSEIDVFDGVPLDNELSANVIDLCPVGALLDKDFLFAQRVWFLKQTPSIDGITSSGDNIHVEHNEGKVYRIKPRTNLEINTWWITDEVRYGWKFTQAENRLRSPMRRRHGALFESDYTRAYDDAVAGIRGAVDAGKRLALMISPMLPCEEGYALAALARALDPKAILGLGPVPIDGKDKHFPPGSDKPFIMRAEKAPNARGIRRVLNAFGQWLEYDHLLDAIRSDNVGAAIITGNYPSDWSSDPLIDAMKSVFAVLIDTLGSPLVDASKVVLPGATWVEKAGTFENADNILQAFEAAIPVIELAKCEGQLALDMLAVVDGQRTHDTPALEIIDDQPGCVPAATTLRISSAGLFNAADTRAKMAAAHEALRVFATDVRYPAAETLQEPDVQLVRL